MTPQPPIDPVGAGRRWEALVNEMTRADDDLTAFLEKNASADVARVLVALAEASIVVARRIRRGSLAGALHADVGPANDGVAQKALDVFADEAFVGGLSGAGVRGVVSEERDDPIALDPEGPLLVAIDPLDGSSNIDANVTIGTVFSVLDAPRGPARRQPFSSARDGPARGRDLRLRPPCRLRLHGRRGVAIATLDPDTETYRITRLARKSLRNPTSSRSIARTPGTGRAPVRAYVEDLLEGEDGPRGRNFNMRWVGSMVADVYRILVRGGVYLYPEDSREGYEHGRLRLLYEANPVAFLIEQAGGAAIDGYRRILAIEPESIHVRTPLMFGAKDKIERIAPLLRRRRRCDAGAIVRQARPAAPLELRGADTHVHQASHHRDHRLFRSRHDIGQEDLRADLPAREDQPGLYRGRRLPSLEPRRDARADEGGGRSAATITTATSAPDANLFEELGDNLPRPIPRQAAARPASMCMTRPRPRSTAFRPAISPIGATFEPGSDLLFYEGLHGAVVTDTVNVAQYVDLKIGVVPVINLEWIQKLHRDKASRGYSTEAVTDTILRRMPDYINFICPQFSQTDINFQRVPTVDTSNPFVARWIPTPDESMVVIRFRNPHGIDFPYLLSMIHNSFMSRANSIVIPGGKLDIAMQLILTPMILKLVERGRRALRA